MITFLARIFIKDYDNVKDPDVRKKYGYLGSCMGIVLNILLFTGKLIAGMISGAISVMADAFNNLSDAGSSIMALVGFKIAGMPADKEHPFGHGRMEYVSGLIISFIIMLMGFELGKSSVVKIFKPEEIEISALTFSILIISVLVKMWMGCFNTALGKKINSTTMKAAAADSISDCIATGAVIIAMIISKFTGVNIDSYMGVAVALFIFRTGFMTAKDSVTPLLGARPDKELVDEIENTVMSYPLIIGVHDLIVNDYGVGNMVISLHAEVPDTTDFNEAHELIDIIEDDLKLKYKGIISIHMDPVAVDDEETVHLKKIVLEIVKGIDEALSIHDFRMTKGKSHINLIFDLVVPFGFRYSDSQVTDIISDKLIKMDSRYFAVINIDRDMC